MQCLIQSNPPKELLLPLVLPLTVVLSVAKISQFHQMINEFLVRVNKSNNEAAGLDGVMVVPTSISEAYSEICATAQLYCQLCWYALGLSTGACDWIYTTSMYMQFYNLTRNSLCIMNHILL